MDEQERVPIWEAMLTYRERRASRFHVPGHKGGSGLDVNAEARALLEGVYSVDLTEIPGLDDLHQPEEAIADAERLASDCYGAEHTYFLVGGSTVGNLALILSLCKPGDLVLVQRDAHKSVINGLMLTGARAVFLSPRIDPVSGLPGGVPLEVVEEALRRYPEAVLLLLTDPNYYGRGVDLRPIVAAAHRRAVPVLVDAAHGAHYGFHPALPSGALAAGADAVVHSTHKMLTAMTMGAMLHVQGGLLDQAAVARALRTLQSSSPSYPILASLDLARRQLRLRGEPLIDETLENLSNLHEQLARFDWLHIVNDPATSKQGSVTMDPLKLVIGDRTAVLSGFELMRELDQRGCMAEMADPLYVVLAFGLLTTRQDADQLVTALQQITNAYHLDKQENLESTSCSNPIELSLLPTADAISEPIHFHYHLEHEQNDERTLPIVKPISEAAGYAAADLIVPYPPGVPLLYPGEGITTAHCTQLTTWLAAGLRVQGINRDGHIAVYRG